ncbi:MAG: hypothetical protein M1570_07730 [Chloroflexi bacterium]|nr:hypothetical protein [Chloroflexota bacterium]
MTHSLHRQGSCASLEHDFPILAMPARQFDIVDDQAKKRTLDKLVAVFDVLIQHAPTNLGSLYVPGTLAHGKTAAELRTGLKPNAVVCGVFSDRDRLRNALSELKARDIGLSVVVSGLMDQIFDLCDEVGLQPHTVDLSLGVWGRKELLPKAELMEITTMCGHALTSPALVEDLVSQVRSGRMAAEAAATELGKPCVCGVFNQKRAAELVATLAQE